MSFKISCPHCMRTLNVSERAIGQTVPCPGCNQPITVPQSFQPARQTSDVAAPAWPGAAQNGDVTPPVAAPSLPPGMPPMPNGVPPPPADPLGFLRSDFVGGQVDGRQNLGDAGGAPGATVVPPRKPAGLVWIVFYWSICGVFGIVGGLVLIYGASFLGSMSQGLGSAFQSRCADEAAIATELMGLVGLLWFHYGLLLELACYGLWTYRRWGPSLAKIMAVVNVIGSLIGLVAALVMRAAIVGTLAGLVISVGIVFYLYGSSNLSERVQQVFSRVRQVDDRTWEGYE